MDFEKLIEKSTQLTCEAESKFECAEKDNDAKCLAQCLDLVATGLELLTGIPVENNPALTRQLCLLLNLRGRARILEVYLHATSPSLRQGVEDLRRAANYAEMSLDLEEIKRVKSDLASGLVRVGEQLSDLRMFREASRRAYDLMDCETFDLLKASDFRMFNVYSVANLRIGGYNGDPGLVEKTARQLRAFLSRDDLTLEAKVLTRKNVIMALLEYARMRKRESIYEALLEKLTVYIGDELPDQEFYLHYRGTVQIELSELNPDIQILYGGKRDIQALLKIPGLSLNQRLTAMQSLAQVHFRLGKLWNSDDDLRTTIKYLEGVLKIVETPGQEGHTLVPRTIADIGAAKHILGKRHSDPAVLSEAENCYIEALSKVAVEASPWLYAKIATGLFLIHFHQEHWSAALNVFAQLEHAWEVVVLDRKATSDIHRQRAFELAGHYSRAAYCHLQLEMLSKAFALIDASRAQSMRAFRMISDAASNLHDKILQEKVQEAEQRWKDAQALGDEEECRFQLRRYLDLLREAGFDEQANRMTEEEILEKVPQGGALVSIFSADRWVRAIIVHKGFPFFQEIELPEDACARIGVVLHGTKQDGTDGWNNCYQRFSRPQDGDSIDHFQKWSTTVEEARSVLGSALMEPIRNALDAAGISERSPVVLLPPGELSALPLANALLSSGENFNEIWPTSSVPSLRQLSDGNSCVGDAGMLIISVDEESEHGGDLHFAVQEGTRLSERFNGRFRKLVGQAAGVKSVLELLPQSSVVHFACHGRYDWENVQRSRIELPNGSALFLAALHPTGTASFSARLVTLSCCETAISGYSLPPDEFEGLLPALLHCGVQAALGALWAVYDDAAMLLTLKFYELYLGEDGNEKCSPALALSHAQSWLRNVRLSELVSGGYMKEHEALTLAEERLDVLRLRMPSVSLDSRSPIWPDTKNHKDLFLEQHGEIQLYTSPVDWAAFVLVGS